MRAERTNEEIAEDDDLDGPDAIALPSATWEVVGHRVEELLAVTETGGLGRPRPGWTSEGSPGRGPGASGRRC